MRRFDTMGDRRVYGWVAAPLLLGAVLAGCSSPPGAAGTQTTSPPPSSASSTTTTAPATSTSTTAGSGAVSGCTFSELKVTAGSTGAGVGHVGGPILFTNVGTSACSLSGYPGVAGLDAAGTQATQAKRTLSGYLGGVGPGVTSPPTVDLAPGQTASALVEGTDVPAGTPPPTSCPQYVGLLVTPPTATQSVHLTMQLPGCSGLEVHPVVSGTTGRST